MLSNGADGGAYSDVDSIAKMKTTPTSTKLSKKGLMSTRYAFEIEIAHQTRTLSWKNSEMMDAHGPLQSLKLVDEGNKVLACFFPGGTRLKPDGSLLVFEDLGEMFTLVTLITALALREKLRRSVNGGYGQRPPLVGAAVG